MTSELLNWFTALRVWGIFVKMKLHWRQVNGTQCAQEVKSPCPCPQFSGLGTTDKEKNRCFPCQSLIRAWCSFLLFCSFLPKAMRAGARSKYPWTCRGAACEGGLCCDILELKHLGAARICCSESAHPVRRVPKVTGGQETAWHFLPWIQRYFVVLGKKIKTRVTKVQRRKP